MGLDDGLKRANRSTYPEILYEMCDLRGAVAPPQFVVSADAHAKIAVRLGDALRPYGQTVVLNTGGGRRWAQKLWTAAHFADFVRLVRRVHPDWAVVVTGGRDEASANGTLIAVSPQQGVFDGGCTHSLEEFGALLTVATVVVTADSLALHMALALGLRAVAIVGPTSPWELEMYGRGEVVHADVPCLACYKPRCPLPVTCMDLLTPQRVFDSVERVVAGVDRSASEASQTGARAELLSQHG